jgi:hypothetical protein
MKVNGFSSKLLVVQVRNDAVSWGTALQAGRSRGQFPMVSYPSGRTMAPGSTQPVTEMSTRKISSGVKAAGE